LAPGRLHGHRRRHRGGDARGRRLVAQAAARARRHAAGAARTQLVERPGRVRPRRRLRPGRPGRGHGEPAAAARGVPRAGQGRRAAPRRRPALRRRGAGPVRPRARAAARARRTGPGHERQPRRGCAARHGQARAGAARARCAGRPAPPGPPRPARVAAARGGRVVRPVRVAVQEGVGFVRVAGAGSDGAPRLIAELPAPGPGTAALLTHLVGAPPEELVLVHPGRWSPQRVTGWAREHAHLAHRVATVPAPLAAAGGGGVAVLDVGASGAEATLLDADGRVRATAAVDGGGRLLDELVAARTGRDPAAARALREASSLLPAVDGVEAAEVRAAVAGPLRAAVAALREVLAGAPRVLVVGGVARTPELARALDEADLPCVEVAP